MALGLGVLVAVEPNVAVVAIAFPVICALLITRFGATGMAILLVLVVALFPVATGAGTPTTLGGQNASTLRTIAIVSISATAVLAFGKSFLASVPRAVVRLITALAVLGALGTVVAALAPFPDPKGTVDSVIHAGGQPLIYAVILGVFVASLRSDERARIWLLKSWCACVLTESVIVAYQFKTGAAYDPLRHITRGYGASGSDFLGAFALMGVFAALYLRASATTDGERWLGTTAAVAGAVLMLSAVARTSVVAFGLGIAVLVLGNSLSARRRLGSALAIMLILVASLFAMRGLWESRLNSQNTRTFDRPATWVSGVRMAEGHPFTGTGSTVGQFVAALQSNNEYRETEYGSSSSVPHNSWIDVFAGDGVFCGLIFLWVTWQFVQCARFAWRRAKERYLLACLVGGGTTYFVNTMFYHPEITVFMLLAVAVIVDASEPRAGSTRIQRDWAGDDWSVSPVSTRPA